jgi:peroxiredoxin
MNKKFRVVKLNDLGNVVARSALSMFEKHYTDKTYMVMMVCNVFSTKECEPFTIAEYMEAFHAIFPLAQVVGVGDVLCITINDAFRQFSAYGTRNDMYSSTGNVSKLEEEIWSEFAKFIKILCDNQIVEVKVRVTSCLPELPSTRVYHDEADKTG